MSVGEDDVAGVVPAVAVGQARILWTQPDNIRPVGPPAPPSVAL